MIWSGAMTPALNELASRLDGNLQTGRAVRVIYSTDASEYQELPDAVAFPRTEAHLRTLVEFAEEHCVGLIPRAAGTSLAGQVVGGGIVVDVGRHLNRIVEIDAARRRARVQPGVVRNELNLALKPHGLFFAPETATANRAMIGGMAGNNSCGSNSIVYGSTRDHVVSARGFLSDGSLATFGPLSPCEFAAKCAGPDTLETRIYRLVRDLLGDPRWLPHPVRGIAWLALRLETWTRRLFPTSPAGQKFAGIVTALATYGVAGGLVWGIIHVLTALHPLAGGIAGAAQLSRMTSKGALSGQPRAPSPVRRCTFSQPSSARIVRACSVSPASSSTA